MNRTEGSRLKGAAATAWPTIPHNPRGLHHDERAFRRFDSPDEFGDDLRRGVVDRQSFIALRKRDVQFVFGDVDFDKHREKRLVIVAAEFSVFRLRI